MVMVTYVADAGSRLIRKVTQAGVVTTVAGSIQGSLDRMVLQLHSVSQSWLWMVMVACYC